MYIRIIVNGYLKWVPKTAIIGYDKVRSYMGRDTPESPEIHYCLPGGSKGILKPGMAVRLKEATIFTVVYPDPTETSMTIGERHGG